MNDQERAEFECCLKQLTDVNQDKARDIVKTILENQAGYESSEERLCGSPPSIVPDRQ